MHEKDKSVLGKVVNQFHTNRLCKLMADHKGTVVIGNAAAHEDGNLTPSVVLNPAIDGGLMSEEVFGPIVGVITYKNIDEAIKVINSKPKPLAVYYFGTNSNKNENLVRLMRETSSGAFVVNDVCSHFINEELPFGGVGESGYGRLHGKEGFDSCCNKKSVLRKVSLNIYPFNIMMAPFPEDKQKMIRLLISRMDYTQGQLLRRSLLIVAVLFFLWLVVTKRLTLQKVKRVWAMLKLAITMLRK